MILKRLRYDDNITDEEYWELIKKYYSSLLSMPFGKKSCLLKYFGDSFFHDCKILVISFIPNDKTINIKIINEMVLGDINQYRYKKGLPEISQKQYWDNPVVHHFRFSNVNNLSCNFGTDSCNIIMDTEILSYDKRKGYELSIQLEADNQISFFCKGTSLILDTILIKKYTNGLKSIPYCKKCKDGLMTRTKLIKYINRISDKQFTSSKGDAMGMSPERMK